MCAIHSFDESLAIGKTGEGCIARWLYKKGWTVLPIYEQEMPHDKGPVLYTSEQALIATDMLAFRGRDVKWIEAKTKSHFSWHRLSSRWVTGIDVRHYNDYIKINEISPWPVWILFLHTDPCGAKDTPTNMQGKSPVGLFGNDLSYLIYHENHRHKKWGSAGMVYWALESLKLLATTREIEMV